MIVTYLEAGVLPEDDRIAKRIVLTQSQYVIDDGVLYRIASDSTLRVIPPSPMRETLFQEAHCGKFWAHLSGSKVHSELGKYYWWEGMQSDITRWSRACLVCATYNPGRGPRPPLSPIPVSGPFDRIGVDVIQFPKSREGNQYAVVFMDYLTKWPETFAVPDQSATTIARLLVEQVLSRHGVPAEILSDRGRAFLSGLMKEVETLLGFHKVNMSAYHPQKDGLVERFNRTLTSMLAKTVQEDGCDWDTKLPYVLFAYRACCHESQESPFYLLYGRDPKLPSPAALNPQTTRSTQNLKDYGLELHAQLSEAWESARKCIGRAQKRQKATYNRKCRPASFQAGERVFLFKPAEKSGQGRKFARPFHGQYRIVEMDNNTAKIRRVDQPQMEPILVAIDRLRSCPEEVVDDYWPSGRARGKARKSRPLATTTPNNNPQATPVEVGYASGREAVERKNGGEVTGDEVVPDPLPGDPADRSQEEPG